MQNDVTSHVQPLVFWQCACGGPSLSKRDYLHLIACDGCTTLADQISDALDDIEKKVGRQHRQDPTS
jgi:hypothetical protein